MLASTFCTSATSLSSTSLGVPAGANRPYQETVLKPGSVSASVGVSGISGERLGSDHGQHAQLAGFDEGQDAGETAKSEWQLPSDHISGRGGGPAIGDVHHVQAGGLLETFRRADGGGAISGRCIVDLAGAFPDVGDQILDCPRLKPRVGNQHIGGGGHNCDRLES